MGPHTSDFDDFGTRFGRTTRGVRIWPQNARKRLKKGRIFVFFLITIQQTSTFQGPLVCARDSCNANPSTAAWAGYPPVLVRPTANEIKILNLKIENAIKDTPPTPLHDSQVALQEGSE